MRIFSVNNSILQQIAIETMEYKRLKTHTSLHILPLEIQFYGEGRRKYGFIYICMYTYVKFQYDCKISLFENIYQRNIFKL